ncbi:3'(2'),5'-bisphosphate nucleotidase CysQ [Dietzia cercidiphylli]|uniref:3'(2'),5'-bisphosphate nucleotidase CysQ n=1 Tax=Dietzia natronolimnaea TaxID=161920 RepID=A0A2A2WPT8_9ACTN|nr:MULTISPECIES: 3'(2'),5'-bisphosphate nucleotidase CysQ [Dietzia]EYT59915.1 MFS transporter [Dietzia sp. UCD-THP]PAY23207.1 3'(2'),5'-bisphosphate nucleotidase CysQ [Dietzia natronolimnaea]
MTAPTRSSDQQLAVDLAADAGRLLVELRSSGPTKRELGDLGDRRANALLLERLAVERPDDSVLSEESSDDLARVDADRVWIIDPVDGTREYGLGDRPDWAVHVALWERSGDPARARLTAAAVSLPALGVVMGVDDDEVYAPPVGNGGVDGGGLLPPRSGSRPRIVLSASRPPAFAEAVAESVGGDLVPLGSAGAKVAAVVRGEADAYIHAGGQYQWDSAAPAGVALARGFVAVRVDGSPLEYNVAETYLPDLVVCRSDLAGAILEAIASA